MPVRLLKLSLIAVGALLLTLIGQAAYAQCCAPPAPPCNCAPPPCCTPPTPPTPPSTPCCHSINVPGVNVNVGANVIVNANAYAIAGAGAGAGAAAYYGGGGGSWSQGEGSVGLIQNLNVENGAQARRVGYEASRKKIRIVVIQAVCIDDQDIPHPASQVTPDKEIDEAYEGELYRCIAGTHMQITIADYNGKIDFDHGQIITCGKGEALYRSLNGEIACKPQKPARDCNERSLLRRYGAGVKILKIITIETYTAYREEQVQSAAVATYSMSLDGGVGGIVH